MVAIPAADELEVPPHDAVDIGPAVQKHVAGVDHEGWSGRGLDGDRGGDVLDLGAPPPVLRAGGGGYHPDLGGGGPVVGVPASGGSPHQCVQLAQERVDVGLGHRGPVEGFADDEQRRHRSGPAGLVGGGGVAAANPSPGGRERGRQRLPVPEWPRGACAIRAPWRGGIVRYG